MSIEIVMSPSGLGKTKYVMNEIKKHRDNNKIIILTPEQNGYNFEKSLCGEFAGTFNIDVYNFNSLLRKFSKELNIEKTSILSEEVKLFYYLQVAEKLKNSNNFLIDRILQDNSFIPIVSSVVDELKQYNVDFDTLNDYIESLEESNHKNKLKAIKEIYVEYINILLENKKFDNEDFFKYLLLNIDYVDLSNYVIYIDGYFNFTKLEYLFIQKLAEKCAKIYITVTTDISRYVKINVDNINNDIKSHKYTFISMEDVLTKPQYNLDIYRKSHEVVANIHNILNNIGLEKCLVTTIFPNDVNNIYKFEIHTSGTIEEYKIEGFANGRYKNEDLSHLVSEYPKIFKSPFKEEVNNVYCYKSNNLENEITQVARNIYRLKKDENYSEEDIAILYRDDSYEKYIDIFKKYNINIHLDKDIDTSAHRLIKLIKNIINYDNSNIKKSLINIFKTQLVNNKDLRDLSIFKIEQFLNVSRVENIQDFSKLLYSEDYFSSEDEFNKILNFIVTLDNKIKKLQSKNKIKEFIKEIVDILDYFDIKMSLEREVENNEDFEELNMLNIDRQVYSKFLLLLNNLEENLGEFKIDFNNFGELLELSINNIKYRSIPEINDCVVMSKADLAKVENKKVAFLIGFNKGVFPSVSKSGLLDDADKENLYTKKIYISPTQKNMLVDEEFVSYISLGRVSEKLFISYSELGSDYREVTPSLYLQTVFNILPELDTLEIDKEVNFSSNNIPYYKDNLSSVYSFSEFSNLYNKLMKNNFRNSNDGEFLLKLYNKIYNSINFAGFYNERVFEVNKELTDENYTHTYSYLINSFSKEKDDIASELQEQLLKEDIFKKYSISKIEEYTRNKYIYFVNRILKVQRKEDYNVNNLHMGLFFHALFDNEKIKKYILNKASILSKYDFEEYDNYIDRQEIANILENVILELDDSTLIKLFKDEQRLGTDRYLIQNLKKRAINAIVIEVKYTAFSNYNILETEKYFSVNLKNSKLNYGDKELLLDIPNNNLDITISGIIDRIDINDGRYSIIDYKTSKKDFNYLGFANEEASQILLYMAILQLIFELDTSEILGVFYRQISSQEENSDKEFRLRGLLNKDLILTENFAQDVDKLIMTRLTKKGTIHGSDNHKAYTASELKKLINKNMNNIVKIINNINAFDFFIEEELNYLYKYANGEDTLIEKDYEKIPPKEVRENILK